MKSNLKWRITTTRLGFKDNVLELAGALTRPRGRKGGRDGARRR